jgi:dipeptidyl aminopeptidase/acylaminoacyl peptidase
VPDIHYKIGYPGKSAYNAVVSAAIYLSKFTWVDSSKMGIQGHSFGGFETCYIVTHTKKFTAACAASPMTNFVSAYGSVIASGISRQKQYEYGRDRIGKNLWEGKKLYIENSPVLNAETVKTPLLIMANDQDGDVPWQQGIEFFTALRRLGKKAWMLQYQGQDHILLDEKAKLDYTIRLKQFFDHYLMGKAAPQWMGSANSVGKLMSTEQISY